MGTKGDFFFYATSIKFISLFEFCRFEIDKKLLSNVGMDQISDKKRGKNKLKSKKKAEDVVDDIAMDDKSDTKHGKNKLKSKKQEAEEHEEQLKRLKETVSCLVTCLICDF